MEAIVFVAQECPLCGTLTEPEQDGDHLYYECEDDDCVGYTWGYARVADPDPHCEIGVPESIRRQHAGFEEKTTTVNLGSRISLRPGA